MPPKKVAGQVDKAKATKVMPARVSLPRTAKTNAAEKAAEPVPKFVEKPAKVLRKKLVRREVDNPTPGTNLPKELAKPLKKTVVKDGGLEKAGRLKKTTELNCKELKVSPSPRLRGSLACGTPPNICGNQTAQNKAGRLKKTKEKKVLAEAVPQVPPSPPQSWPMSPSGIIIDDINETVEKLDESINEARERFKAVYEADPDANGIIPLNKYVIYSKRDPRGKRLTTKNTPKKIEKTAEPKAASTARCPRPAVGKDASITTRRCSYGRPTMTPLVLSSLPNKSIGQLSDSGLFPSTKGRDDKHHCDGEIFDNMPDDEEWPLDGHGNPANPTGPFSKMTEMTQDYANGWPINPNFKGAIKRMEDITKLENLVAKLGPGHPNVQKMFAKVCRWNGPDPPPTPATFFIFPRDSQTPVRSAGFYQINCGCGIERCKDETICTLGPNYQATFISSTPGTSYTREELVIMIETATPSVLLDCPNCKLVVQHGLPLPLPFKLKAKCTCTHPQLQAQQYREQPVRKASQKGKKGNKVALEEVELEIAIRDQRELLKELVDTSEADTEAEKYRQVDRNDSAMCEFDLAFLDDGDEGSLFNGRWETNSAKLAAAKKEIDELLKEGHKHVLKTGRHSDCRFPRRNARKGLSVARKIDLGAPLPSPNLPRLKSPISPRKRGARSPKKG